MTEGVATAPAMVALAKKAGIEMPICAAVNAILSDSMTVPEAMNNLLARPFTGE